MNPPDQPPPPPPPADPPPPPPPALDWYSSAPPVMGYTAPAAAFDGAFGLPPVALLDAVREEGPTVFSPSQAASATNEMPAATDHHERTRIVITPPLRFEPERPGNVDAPVPVIRIHSWLAEIVRRLENPRLNQRRMTVTELLNEQSSQSRCVSG